MFGGARQTSDGSIWVIYYDTVPSGEQARNQGMWPINELQNLAQSCTLSAPESLISPDNEHFGIVGIECPSSTRPWNSMRLAVKLEHGSTTDVCLNVGDTGHIQMPSNNRVEPTNDRAPNGR